MFKRIQYNEMSDLLCLYMECFEDDKYYKKYFSIYKNPDIMRKKVFRKAIKYCLQEGIVYGEYDDDKLIAFIICFDYQFTKKNRVNNFAEIFGITVRNRKLLNTNTMHDRIDTFGENVIYLLGIGVKKEYRRRGIASKLIDFIIYKYERYHIVSDVSNRESLSIYAKRDFSISDLEEDYFFIYREPKKMFVDEHFDDNINLIIPVNEEMSEIFGKEYKIQNEEIQVKNFKTVVNNGCNFFVREFGNIVTAIRLKVNYQQLLEYQRYLGMSLFTEIKINNKGILYYLNNDALWEGTYMNDVLKSKIENCNNEWSIISDVHVMIPIEYNSKEKIYEKRRTEISDVFIDCMQFRTKYEAGIPARKRRVDNLSGFKERINRIYLGRIKMKIVEEMSIDCRSDCCRDIGKPSWADLFITIDDNSRCGVITIAQFSSQFMLSQFMDNIIRNQLYIYEKDAECWINMYDYLAEKYDVFKRGSAKICVTIPKKKDCLNINQIGSLLMAETIYNTDEQLGGFIDRDELDKISSEYGMGQYDRAFVCASSNVFLQFCDELKTNIGMRIYEETITLFYIELILLEESAINIVDNNIESFLSSTKRISPTKYLKRIERIHSEYTKSIAFWDVQVNYPSSKKSINMLRDAFLIDKQLNTMKRNKEQLQTMFETQRDIMDRVESTTLNYIVLFLTVVQCVQIFFPEYFGDDNLFTHNGKKGVLLVIVVLLIYRITKRILSVNYKR